MRKLLIILVVASLFAVLTGGASAQDVPDPAITITSPAWGSVVGNTGPITVNGIATNLFEGGLTVQALTANGTVLDEKAVTAPGAALGGTGTWTTELTVDVEANTTGKIYAYATSPKDGSLAAQASIDVTFGVQTPPASISITTPPAGSVLNTTGGIVVTGTASNLPAPQFTLQARDASGNVLAQTGVTAGATWQATLNPLLTTNTPGMIFAYDEAVDGVYMTQATVNVTFLANCAPRTDWPVYQVQVGDNLYRIAQRVGSTMAELTTANCLGNPSVIVVGSSLYVPKLPTQEPTTPDDGSSGGDGGMVDSASITITSPEQGDEVTLGSPIAITGTGALLFEGNVVVRLMDAQGNVLTEAPTTLTNVQFDGTGTWEIDLPLETVLPMRGTIFAYSTGGMDGSIIVSDAVNVVFGAAPPAETYVTIDSPIPYTNVTGTTFTVSGRAERLPDPEGTLVVEARDYSGRILAQKFLQRPATPWSTELTANVALGTHITIRAYPLGEASLSDPVSVAVVINTPDPAATHVSITYPLPGDVMATQYVSLSAGGVPEGALVMVEAVDADGTQLDLGSAQSLTDGLWEVELGFEPAMMSGEGALIAYFADPATGRVLAYDRIPVMFGE